jgi:DNA-binding MarR family transcriptional regulator
MSEHLKNIHHDQNDSEINQKRMISHLIGKLCHTHWFVMNEKLQEIGLYEGQHRIIMHLLHHEGMSQKHIVETMATEHRVQPATMSKTINRLEKKKIITTKKDPEDKRITKVFLTDEGKKLKEPIINIFHLIHEKTFENISNEEQILLKDLLSKMTQNIQNLKIAIQNEN